MTIPDPMPVAGWPNGEKPSVETPLAVIVTTDFWASAMTSVRSRFWTVVALVVFAAPMDWTTPAAPGTSCVIAATVPPAASVALRTAAARTMPIPPLRPRSARVAAGVEPATGADVAEAVGADRCPAARRRIGRAGQRPRGHRGGRRCRPQRSRAAAGSTRGQAGAPWG